MKKEYIAPSVVFEHYALDTNIASNCGIVVDNGPAMGRHELCESYAKIVGITYSQQSVHNVTFYEDTNCDCYTTGNNFGFWTS